MLKFQPNPSDLTNMQSKIVITAETETYKPDDAFLKC